VVERSKTSRDQALPIIGKAGPQPFKAVKPPRTRGHQTHDDSKSVRYENTQDGQDRYSPSVDDRGFTAPGKKASFKPLKSKLNQSTKFNTPSEKGARPHLGNSRSSNTSHRGRSRHNAESEGMIDSPQDEHTPTAASKVIRHRGRKAEPELTFNIDQEFDDSTLIFDGPSDDRLDYESNEQGMSNTIPPTPPSDRTLALGSDLHAKPPKGKITLSSGIDLGSDGLGDDMMEMFDDVVKDVSCLDRYLKHADVQVVGPTTRLQLKMPKTVDQVVKHISTILAKKVAKEQGEIAIKSSENWDWSRLSGMYPPIHSPLGTELMAVLSSEMNESIKEMENMIKGAGESKS